MVREFDALHYETPKEYSTKAIILQAGCTFYSLFSLDPGLGSTALTTSRRDDGIGSNDAMKGLSGTLMTLFS